MRILPATSVQREVSAGAHTRLLAAFSVGHIAVSYTTAALFGSPRACVFVSCSVFWLYGTVSVSLHERFEPNVANLLSWFGVSGASTLASLALASTVDALLQ